MKDIDINYTLGKLGKLTNSIRAFGGSLVSLQLHVLMYCAKYGSVQFTNLQHRDFPYAVSVASKGMSGSWYDRKELLAKGKAGTLTDHDARKLTSCGVVWFDVLMNAVTACLTHGFRVYTPPVSQGQKCPTGTYDEAVEYIAEGLRMGFIRPSTAARRVIVAGISSTFRTVTEITESVVDASASASVLARDISGRLTFNTACLLAIGRSNPCAEKLIPMSIRTSKPELSDLLQWVKILPEIQHSDVTLVTFRSPTVLPCDGRVMVAPHGLFTECNNEWILDLLHHISGKMPVWMNRPVSLTEYPSVGAIVESILDFAHLSCDEGWYLGPDMNVGRWFNGTNLYAPATGRMCSDENEFRSLLWALNRPASPMDYFESWSEEE
jgi:hypothetical protein